MLKRSFLYGLFIPLGLFLSACSELSEIFFPPPSLNPPDPSQCPVGPMVVLKRNGEAPYQLQGLAFHPGEWVPGEILVRPKPGLSLKTLRGLSLGEPAPLPGGVVKLQVPPGREKQVAGELMDREKAIYFAQPNYVYRPLFLPNDPYYGSLQKPYLQSLMFLERAWEVSTGRGCPPSVAILDTGYRPHEDVSMYLPLGMDLDVADRDPDPTDRTRNPGHGLGVASILGANTHNGKGMAGMSWGGWLVPIKVFPDSGEATTEHLVRGVELARSLRARVLNLSLGTRSQGDPLVEEALRRAREGGGVIVVAAGNDGTRGVSFPARLPTVLAVGAVDLQGRRASFSSFGPELDLVAPGQDVVAAIPEDRYGFVEGTSFAAPLVAGAAVLYMSRYASERGAWPSPDRVEGCLRETAQDLGPAGHDEEYGHGLVRPDRLLGVGGNVPSCFP